MTTRTEAVKNYEQTKREIRRLAVAGARRPASSGPNKTAMGRKLAQFTNLTESLYDLEFDREVRALRPDWFLSTADMNKADIRALALAGGKRPPVTGRNKHRLGKPLCSYTTPSCVKTYDAGFDLELRALRPDWFVRSDAIRRAMRLKADG
jgi:hypothetical protein